MPTAQDGTEARSVTAVLVGYGAVCNSEASVDGLISALIDATPPTGSHNFAATIKEDVTR